jgi:hypothetical protein
MSPTTDKLYFCPACGSASVHASPLTGGNAACNICSWTGTTQELAALPFQHALGGPDDVYRAFFLDVRALLSKDFAIAIAHLLKKWGFLEELDPRVLARYIAAIAKGLATAVAEERQTIEKERIHGTARA